MTATKTGRKALFRMTTARSILLSGVITTLNSKIDNIDEDGFARRLILNSGELSKEERANELMELDKQLETYYLYHDVLEIVNIHSKEYLRQFFLKRERTWQNEWEIPLETFNEAIEGTIDVMRWYQVRGRPEFNDKYEKKIAFLEELKDFRNR